MVQGGLPEGSSILLQGPPGQEKLRFALTFLAEGLKGGGSGLVVSSSQSPDAVLAELRELGVNLDAVTKENRLRVVDWYSWSEEPVEDVEERGAVVRSSIDLTNLDVALSRAIAGLVGELPRRAVIEILSPATNVYEVTQVYAFAQSAKKKFDRARFTSLVLVEKDMHSAAELTTLHQPFDGVIEIERSRSGDRIVRKIGVLHMKDTAPDASFRILEVTEAGMKVVREASKPAAPGPSHSGGVLESQDERARRLHLIMQIASERLKLNPSDPDALFALAAAQATLDDAAGGVQTLDRLAALDPNYPGLWVLKTKLHARLGQTDLAKESRVRAAKEEGEADLPAGPTVPCPMCEAPVAPGATTCENCGIRFTPARTLEDELDDLGHAAIQEMVQEELAIPPKEAVAPPKAPAKPGPKPEPRPPEKSPTKKGMTNGLVLGRVAGRRTGMTNGLKGRTNGLRGRTNGLTNGLGRTNGLTNGVGRTNGLTNGLGRTNGLTNGLGRTNGLTNGLGRTNGLTNGLGRTNGLTNGLGGVRPAGFHSSGVRGMMRNAGWKLYLIPLVSVALLLMPLFLVPEYQGPAHPIRIDGQFGDWASVSTEAMTSGTAVNPNIDVVRFGAVDNLGPFAFYVQVVGNALAGGGPSPGMMDTIRIFIDSDGAATTGYRIDGLGADRMIDISGYGGTVRTSTLWEFDSNRDSRDWNGWIKGTGTPAVAAGSQVEAEAEWLSPSTTSIPLVASVHTASWDGTTDSSDFPISPSVGTLSVIADPQVPDVLAGVGVPLLQLTLTAHGQSVSVDSLQVELIGTAPPTSAVSLRLMEGTTVLGQVTPTSRDVTFSFPALSVIVGSTTTLTLVGDFTGSTGETFGVRLPPSHPFGFAKTIVGLQQNAGARTVGYLGVVPGVPVVDGAFDEWTTVSSDSASDVTPRANPSIDVARYGALHGGAATYLYTDVTGRILKGTSVPELAKPTPPTGPPPSPDTDRDTVPDSIDPMPFDFNNDGIPDAQTNGDYDGDGITDYGFPGGTDNWLNTTLPGTFPPPYGGQSVSIYIGPTTQPPRFGDDVLRIFLDVDNSTLSGYAIGGIGADRLVEIRGKDGTVTQSALLAFSGSFPGEWSWTAVSPVTVALGYRAIELSVPVNATNLYVETGDFWGSTDSTSAVPALVRQLSSFKVAPSTSPLSVPWVQVSPQPTIIDPGSNAVTTNYNQQRKVVRAGDVAGQTACDAANSDGCWYVVFYDQLNDTVSAAPSRKVQTGSVTLSAGSASVDVAITSIVTAKAFLTFGANFNDANPGFGAITGTVVDATTLRFQRATAASSPAIPIQWYVAEFASGVTVQRGTATMASATLDVLLSSVTLTKSFPIVSYRKSGTDYGDDDFLKAKITTSTNLQLSLVSAGSPADGVAAWQVVEYTDASVQTGDLSFANGDSSLTASVPGVDTGRSWLLFTYSSATGVTANIGEKMVRGLITDSFTLTFDRSNSGQSIGLTWYLVSFTDSTTVQSGTVNFAPADTQKDVAIPCIDTTKAIATAGGMYYRGGRTPYGSDDNPGVATVTLEFTSSTNLRLTRGFTGGNNADIGYFAVEFGTGCKVAGTFPNDIQTEDGAFIQYREANVGAQAGAGNNPTATGTSPACAWTTCSNGETSNDAYATSATNGEIVSYKTFGFNIPSGSSISKVQFGVEAFQGAASGSDKISGMKLSWDGGTTYCGNSFTTTPPTSDPNAYTDFVQTSCTGHTWAASDFTGDLIAWQGAYNLVGGFANLISLDAVVVEVAYTPPTSYKLDLRYDWSGVPVGADTYALKVKGYRQDENVNVQVLTPPSTWNTRITISATSNTLYTYAITTAELNSGAPSVRLIDASGSDATQSDLWLDLAVVTSTSLWDRIILMRSSDTSGSTWGSQLILASGRSADNPLLSSYDSAEPSIAMDSSGYLHVVWVSASSTGNQNTLNLVRYTKSTVAYPNQAEIASAANWQAVAAVDDSSLGYMPTISTDSGNNPHFAWSASKTSGTVYYKNSYGGTPRPTVAWGTVFTGMSVDVSPQNDYVSLARYDASLGAIQYLVCKDLAASNCDASAEFTKWDGTAGFDTVSSMATVQSITPTSFAADSTTHNVQMPATVNAGDLLIAFIATDGTPGLTTPSGWTWFFGWDSWQGTGNKFSMYAKKAVGTEGGTTVNFVTSVAEKAAAQVYRITGWRDSGTITNDIEWANAGATSTTPDPPSLNPVNWDVEGTLWIASYGAEDNDDLTSYPTGYSGGTFTKSDVPLSTTSTSMASAWRNLAAASEDPGTFTTAASKFWIASTVAVRPAVLPSSPMFPTIAHSYESNGDVWVAYAKVIDGTTTAIYARFLDYPSGGWQTEEVVALTSGTVFARPSIGIDVNNDVHALYVAASAPQLYYEKRTGGSWGAATAVDASSDNPTLVVRAPNNLVYGTDVGALYWKTTSSETYFFHIPEFESVAVPVLGAILLGVVFRGRARRHSGSPPRHGPAGLATPHEEGDVPRQ